jgi:hypothetical protein
MSPKSTPSFFILVSTSFILYIYTIKDVETRIKNDGVDLGDIGCRFYTEDENTASIRIGIDAVFSSSV